MSEEEQLEMCLEANRDMTHGEMQQEIVKALRKIDYYVETEVKLKNGRIADIVVLSEYGVVIVEVKAIFRQSLLEAAYGKYAEHCDWLVFATPPHPLLKQMRKSLLTWCDRKLEKVGVWTISWEEIAVVRHPTRLR